MSNFEIGQKIRSYDFVGRDDCYIEGEVIEITKGMIHYRVTKAVSQGEKFVAPAPVMRTPDLGNCMTDRIHGNLGTQRIEAI